MTGETTCKLSVCPHDTAKNQIGWFTLNTYLQRKLSVRMHLEPQDDLMAERAAVLASPHHVVYANPFSAYCFAEQGYVPVARPAGQSDETVLVAKADFDLAGAARPIKVASANAKVITHPLGLTLLSSLGLAESDVAFEFCGSHMNAVKAVLGDKAQMAFVFDETWNGLNSSTRGGFKVISQTNDGKAFHCFMVGPEWKDKAGAVQEVLCGMAGDPAGKKILDELGFSGFEPVDAGAIAGLKALVEA